MDIGADTDILKLFGYRNGFCKIRFKSVPFSPLIVALRTMGLLRVEWGKDLFVENGSARDCSDGKEMHCNKRLQEGSNDTRVCLWGTYKTNLKEVLFLHISGMKAMVQ